MCFTIYRHGGHSWSRDQDHFNKFAFPNPTGALFEGCFQRSLYFLEEKRKIEILVTLDQGQGMILTFGTHVAECRSIMSIIGVRVR